MINAVITTARKWTGYLEKKSNAQLESYTANAGNKNYTIFSKSYDEWWKYVGFRLQGDAWCAGFVSYIFRVALGKEVQEKIMPNFHYCPTGVNQFKKLGGWVTSNPKAGDVIFFKNSGGISNHVGIVRAVDKSYVYTVEGNTSSAAGVVANGGCVAEKSYKLNYASILGYGRPKYEDLGGLTMTQYEELKGMIGTMQGQLEALGKKTVYNWVDENMPEWARPTITKLYNSGVLRGDENGLNLDDDMLRTLVVLDRAGAFGA